MKKFTILLSLVLGACSSIAPSNAPVTEALILDPKLLQACTVIVPTEIKTPDDILIENIDLYEKYGECARKQDASIKALKLIGDIK